MKVDLDHKGLRILKAALHELDLSWRKGIANSGFSQKTTELLGRGNSLGVAPIHESNVGRLIELLEEEGTKVTITSGASDA